MINLKIDPEFQSQIPPLTDEEFKQLEENILKEGKLLSPLIVWGNTLVDGHNRYAILQKHPEISFSTMPLPFESREEVLAWICKNQLGRRNLTPEQKKFLMGKQYSSEKRTEAFRGNQHTAKKSGSVHELIPVAACWCGKTDCRYMTKASEPTLIRISYPLPNRSNTQQLFRMRIRLRWPTDEWYLPYPADNDVDVYKRQLSSSSRYSNAFFCKDTSTPAISFL